jgi:hypothetical protein
MEGSDYNYLFVLLTSVEDPSLLSRQLLFILNEALSLNMITLERQSRGSPHVVLRVRPGHLAFRVHSSNSTDLPVAHRLALGSPLCTFTGSPSTQPAAIPRDSDSHHKLPNISPSRRSMANVSGGWRSILRVHLQGGVEPPPAVSSPAVLLLALPSATCVVGEGKEREKISPLRVGAVRCAHDT